MPDVVITLKTIDQSTATVKKVKDEFKSLSPALESAGKGIANFASANATLIAGLVAVGAGLKKSYDAFQKYAGSVRDLAQVSGTGAVEASKLLQVLDDFQLSAEDVTAATRIMTKNGLTPTLDTLAKLSDQYKAINDPMEKNAFIIENLGRNGFRWANALDQGGDALKAMGDEVNKSLILTDEQIKKAEMARLAVDAWADAWEGFKVSVGGAIGNIIAVNAATQDMGEQFFELTGQMPVMAGKITPAFERFRNEMEKGAAMTEHYKKMYSDMAGKVTQDTIEMQQARAEEINAAISIQKANDNYYQSQEKVTQSLKKEQAELDRLNQGYYAYTGANANAAIELANITNKINAFIPGVTGSQQELHKMMQTQGLLNDMLAGEEPVLVKNTEEIEKQTEKVKELQDAQKAAAEEFGKAQTEKLAMMSLEKIEFLDGEKGFTDAEAAKARAILETADVAQLAAFNQAQAFEAVSTAIANGTMKAEDMKSVLDEMSKGYTIDVAINIKESREVAAGVGSQTAGQQSVGWQGGMWAGGNLGIPGFAGGGKSGGWGVVGDKQGGGFIPGVSELIYGNARVFNSRQSEKMLRSGMFGKVPGFAIGGNLTGGARKPWGSSLGGGNNGDDENASMSTMSNAPEMQAISAQVANDVAAQVNITMQTYMATFVQSIDSGFAELGAIMRDANPRAVGKYAAAAFVQTQV